MKIEDEADLHIHRPVSNNVCEDVQEIMMEKAASKYGDHYGNPDCQCHGQASQGLAKQTAAGDAEAC
jgi:hypothetical protein